MTTRKGNTTKKVQNYQNKTKFRHNKGSKLTQQILASPIEGLCKRCSEIIQWKKDYRRYKPLTEPKKCSNCNEKTVIRAYHILCQPCATKKGVCAKCKEEKPVTREFDQKKKEEIEQRELEAKLKTLHERDRKAYLRQVERGDFDEDEKESFDGDDDSEEGDGANILVKKTIELNIDGTKNNVKSTKDDKESFDEDDDDDDDEEDGVGEDKDGKEEEEPKGSKIVGGGDEEKESYEEFSTDDEDDEDVNLFLSTKTKKKE
eukprot:TRINITY_DN1070_c2_g1_i1.p1 TRINITY_DN1070_c2_g1~~TRINITY_DN1070_c2_g1_i1.p1  ORF type:complete len:287 (-),score=102.55 TRINITY_DN1070_c2_g1_i1:344-1123(-)